MMTNLLPSRGTATLLLLSLSPPSACTVHAFGPVRRVLSAAVNRALSRVNPLSDPRVFEDVGLPYDITVSPRQKNINAKEEIAKVETFTATTAKELAFSFLGKPKPTKDDELTEPDNPVLQKIIDGYIKQNPDDPDPVPGYLYYGNNKFSEILPLLCKTNPFWASALTATDDGEHLELVAFKADPPSPKDSYYLTVMRLLKQQEVSHRINVRFDLEMKIDGITTFDDRGNPTVVRNDAGEWDYYASGAIYNMMYYVSAIHATIHTLHYLMTHAVAYAARKDEALTAWCQPYDDNVAYKYRQVAKVLFHSNIEPDDPQALTERVVSGKLGFGASVAILKPLRDILCSWGQCKTAEEFVATFVLKGVPRELVEKAEILTEFNKHVGNVRPFAEDLSAAMKASDPAALRRCERVMTRFLRKTGDGVSSIDSISSWAQLMSCTGIVHGCTLSYSRLMALPEVVRWRNINAATFDQYDAEIAAKVAATIVGMIVDRHVFSSEMDNPPLTWDTEHVDPGVMAVIDKYDRKADALKKAYEEAIVKRADFREYGWILSDHCRDGFDGKQHTITTYI